MSVWGCLKLRVNLVLVWQVCYRVAWALELQDVHVTILAYFASLAAGSNDVANAFGTSVGAKTLSLRQAVIVSPSLMHLDSFGANLLNKSYQDIK